MKSGGEGGEEEERWFSRFGLNLFAVPSRSEMILVLLELNVNKAKQFHGK